MSNILIQFFERMLCSRSKNRNISFKKENQEQTGYIYKQNLGVQENKQNSKSFANKKHSSTTSALIYPVKRIRIFQKVFHTNETIPFNKKFCISLLFPDIEHIYNLYVMSIENSLT